MKQQSASDSKKLNVLQRFSLFFFSHLKVSALLWVALVVFGVLCYTTLLQRQGFPSVNVPYSMVNGAYFVDDQGRVDKELAKPITAAITRLPEVEKVTSRSDKNFVMLFVQYKEDTNLRAGTSKVESTVSKLSLPAAAKLEYQAVDAGRFNNKYDLMVSTYNSGLLPAGELTAQAQKIASNLSKTEGVASVEVVSQYKAGRSPVTGQEVTQKNSFDRVAVQEEGQLNFHQSVSVGVIAKPGTDALKLYDSVKAKLDSTKKSSVHTLITANHAENVRMQIHALQSNLAEGLFIVIIVSFLLISWRAGLATALSMATVLFMTVGALKLFGYTLNTITLFALILSLALIVDDTTIVAEAIDAGHKQGKSRRDTVAEAIRRIARASLAGTSVTILTFAPMLFIGGILGSFIRALPITIITSIALSWIVSVSLIPFLSRSLILGKEKRAKEHSRNPVIQIEHKTSSGLANVIRNSAGKRKRQVGLALAAFALSFAFLAGSAYFMGKLKFNIFPPSKDGNVLMLSMEFDPGTTVEQAEGISERADAIVRKTLRDNAVRAEYLSSGNAASALLQINLVSYGSRQVSAPELASQLGDAFKGFSDAKIKVTQQAAGPPSEAAPFKVQVQTEDAAKAEPLIADILAYLKGHQVTRPNGTTVRVTDAGVTDQNMIIRSEGKRIFEVHAGFAADDTSALVALAQKDVEDKFNAEKLATYGLGKDNLKFDFGLEQQNQDSFKAMLVAFPILLLSMFVLLAILFRSLLQPLLIFMAIPFSFFGVAAGLYITDNPLSFFVMLGFFALIGIAVNNTIMVVDYANQARREGASYTEAMATAIQHRFRPLLATSLTGMVALTPLALHDPFWQSLAVTLIFGLLSSTFLVIVAFPYYWLSAEWVRIKAKRLLRKLFRRPGTA